MVNHSPAGDGHEIDHFHEPIQVLIPPASHPEPRSSNLCPIALLIVGAIGFFAMWAATAYKAANDRDAAKAEQAAHDTKPYWARRGFDSYASYAEHVRRTGHTPLSEAEANEPAESVKPYYADPKKTKRKSLVDFLANATAEEKRAYYAESLTPLPRGKDEDRPVAAPDPPEFTPVPDRPGEDRSKLAHPVQRIEFPDRQPGPVEYAGPWRVVLYTGCETKTRPPYRVWIVKTWRIKTDGWVEFEDENSTGLIRVKATLIEPCPEGTLAADGDGTSAPGELQPVPRLLPPFPPREPDAPLPN